MTKLTANQTTWLRERFGSRVNLEWLERKIYSHDIGVMPPLVKPLIGKGLAEAIVQPQNEAEVVDLVRWANQQHVPLIPRGKATSGYGGVLPVKGGITLDTYRMRKLLAVDAENLTVTVEPGMIWQKLETILARHGLALRLYPSSAPSSTVGGWLAQGGFGYGSLEYGSFPRNVVAARVVLPNGDVRTFSGNELEWVADAEGITGLITQVTLRVRTLEAERVVGVRFDDVGKLAAALQQIVREELPIWSISFINPNMARLKNQRPSKKEHGHPASSHNVKIPEAYVAIVVLAAARMEQAGTALERIVAEHGGERIADDLAQHEWDERFKIMHIKRLGPSLIPTEVVLPLDNLSAALADIEGRIRQPLAIEGIVAGGERPEVIILGFIPHDERSWLYNLAFGLSLSAIQRAKRHGGRAYASGLYFAHEARNILGGERIERLQAFKQQVDPNGIMNPGKVVGSSLLGTFMSVAGALEPLVCSVANLARVPIGERINGNSKRGIAADVAWYAYACAQCGNCVDGCDQFYGRGWESQSPRGKWFFLKEYLAGRSKIKQSQVDTFLACTTCEVCNAECPLELPIESSWLKMRGGLIHENDHLTFPPFEMMRASLLKEGNIWGAYRKDRPNWAAAGIDSIPEQADICYFPGCTASYVEHDIAQSTACLLRKAGVEFTYLGEDEACCGIPMLVAGLWDAWEKIMRHNIAAMEKRGVKTVITSCPACWLVWKQYYPEWAKKLGIRYDLEALHYSEVLAAKIASGEMVFDRPVEMRVTWHDSCHMGRAGGIYEAPRQVIQAIPGIEFVEMEHNREQGHCCGSVLSLVADPPVAQRIGDIRLQEADAVHAEAVVTSCPCCEVQLRVTVNKTGRDMPIIDLGSLACQSAGIPHPDPTPYALEMWATFEAMINLLKPEQMASLMVALLPQMLDAMPMGMGGMMRAIGRMGPVGGTLLKAMKPLFPILFPLLMPGMMPKVLPDMLTAVEARVPMPPHMKEQMPELMPAVMDQLMPKMLPSIVPLISDPLIEHLQNGAMAA